MTSSTFAETGARGKNTKSRPFSESDRVRDDGGESFGKSRVTFAFERKMALRLAARERRARYLMTIGVLEFRPRNVRTPVVSEPRSDDARELGIHSYRRNGISLPYVSILGSTTTGEAR